MAPTLQQKRGTTRASLTRLVTRLDQFLADDTLPLDRKIFEIDRKLQDLRSKMDTIIQQDAEVVDSLPDDEVEQELADQRQYSEDLIDERDRFEYQLQVLNKRYDAENPTPPLPGNASPSTSNNDTSDSVQINLPINSKLPKFELPDFSGDILTWHSFWDVFETEVDKRTSIADATKFIYLNSKLKGEAKATLSGLTPNNVNYAKAVTLLKERYGQPNKIVAAHMRALYHLSKPNSDKSSLRQFMDRLEVHIRCLEALGKTTDTYGDLLVYILLDKIQTDVRQNLVRHHGATDWSLQQFREAMEKEIRVLEDVPSNNNSAATRPKSNAPQGKRTHVIAVKADKLEKPRKCAFCEGPHFASECTKYSTVESRIKYVQENSLCFNCLTSKTHSLVKDCRSSKRCFHCGKAHHSSLHRFENDTQASGASSTPPNNAVINKSIAVLSAAPVQPSENVLIATNLDHAANAFAPYIFVKTAVAYVQTKSLKSKANLIIDECAQHSFIRSSLARALKLVPIRKKMLSLSGFQSASEEAKLYDIVRISIVDINKQHICIEPAVVEDIIPPLNDSFRELAMNLPYLKDLKLAHQAPNRTLFEIDILIGADYYWTIVGDQVVRGSGPTAVFSRLGYLLSGPLSGEFDQEMLQSTLINIAVVEEPNLDQLWALEALGIQPENETSDYAEVYQRDDIIYSDGVYTARFPWLPNRPEITRNQVIAEKRTRSTVRNLARSPTDLLFYHEMIQDQIRKGIIEKVPASEFSNPNCHFVPHFGVKRDSLTTPVRIVYDFSCKDKQGVSLNDCLESGPPLHNNLLAILLRFRVHRFGIAADIERAFHQIRLHVDDRDYTRFVWISDVNDPASSFEVYRFCVIPFGARCSPFILLSAIRKHLLQDPSEFSTDLYQSIYVDNLFLGVDEESEARPFYEKTRAIFKKAGLELKTWSSNSTELERQAGVDGVLDTSTGSKALGLLWNRQLDTLELAPFNITAKDLETSTKRDVLSGLSAIYDPLGFITPLTIGMKILMQDLWLEKLKWDEILPESFRRRWTHLLAQVNKSRFSFQRSYFKSSSAVRNLHLFVDASVRAYGVVAYLVHERSVSLIYSKARVSPLKGNGSLTLPQKELMAAYLGSLVAAAIIESFKSMRIELKISCWSDNQIVLYWLSNPGRHKLQFVANRVEKIKAFNSEHQVQWRYVPTADNPADLLTRGIDHEQFLNSSWTTGPSWLTDSSTWPVWKKSTATLVSLIAADPEVADGNVPEVDNEMDPLEKVIDSAQYRWTKLIRVTAYVLRIQKNFKAVSKLDVPKAGFLSTMELFQAELEWIKIYQRRFLFQELSYLYQQKGPRPTLVSQLDLFLDENGVIRCGGRLKKMAATVFTKHPILLPKSSELTIKIIGCYHEQMLHGTIGDTVCAIRQRFWIPAIRQQVKKTIHSCTRCRRISGPPYATPDHAALPDFRVNRSRPFQHTGVDYTGAYTVRVSSKGADLKVYIVLFTCSSTRAIHLEVVDSLTTEAFIQAFRRFASHHSLPDEIISDNASTFQAANRILRQVFHAAKTHQFFTDKKITWKFIPKRAPWYGGFYERLIGSTKTALKKMMGRTKLVLVEFQTLVAEIEAILNDRPLTKVTSNIEDEPLTPAHLLYGRRVTTLPSMCSDLSEINDPSYGDESAALNRNFVRVQKIKEAFWKQWSRAYLTALREFHQSTRRKSNPLIKVGDVVLVHDDGPRLQWKLAVVHKLITSADDGLIRAAEIRTTRGITSRPVGKLYPLEVQESASDPVNSEESAILSPDKNRIRTRVPTSDPVNSEESAILSSDKNRIRTRVQRQAALDARSRIQEQVEDD